MPKKKKPGEVFTSVEKLKSGKLEELDYGDVFALETLIVNPDQNKATKDIYDSKFGKGSFDRIVKEINTIKEEWKSAKETLGTAKIESILKEIKEKYNTFISSGGTSDEFGIVRNSKENEEKWDDFITTKVS